MRTLALLTALAVTAVAALGASGPFAGGARPGHADTGRRPPPLIVEADADLDGHVHDRRTLGEADGDDAAGTAPSAERPPLPVAARVRLRAADRPVDSTDLPEHEGQATLHIQVRNTSAELQRLAWRHAGRTRIEDAEVPLPLITVVTARFDDGWRDLHAPGAAVAHPGDGTVEARWFAALFEPVGELEVELVAHGRVDDAAPPAVTVETAPIVTEQAPAPRDIVELLRERQPDSGVLAFTLRELTTSLDEATEGATRLGGGAAELADGLAALADGNRDLARGSERLAAGLDELATGATEAAGGSRHLHHGADAVAKGVTALADTLEQLPAPDDLPIEEVVAELGVAQDLLGDITALLDEAGTLSARLAEADVRLDELDARLAAETDDHDSESPQALVDDVRVALRDARGDLDALAARVSGLVDRVDGHLARLIELLDTLVADGLPDPAGQVRELASGARQVAGGLAELTAGLDELAHATAEAHDGARHLAQGASELAEGSAAAADGAAELADGVEQLRDGARALMEVTEQAADAGSNLAGRPARQLVLLDAMDDRIRADVDAAADPAAVSRLHLTADEGTGHDALLVLAVAALLVVGAVGRGWLRRNRRHCHPTPLSRQARTRM